MVYAYDLWAQLPVRDLYNTQVMAMAINAAKSMYDDAKDLLKEFRKEYGDFMSPFAKDVEWYNRNFNVADKIGEIYARGGDPLRNSSDRGEIYRWINSRPYAEYNLKKLRAANYETYRKNMAELDAQGAYNPAMEQYALLLIYGPKAVGDPSTWDLDAMGISDWSRLSPVRAKSLKELTESSYNNITPHELTKEQVLSFPGAKYDPTQKYMGTTYQDLINVANTAAPGLMGTPYYAFYRNEAAKKLIASGQEPTNSNIDKQLAKDIADSQIEYLKQPVGSIDEWYKKQSLNLQQQRLNVARLRLAQHNLDRNDPIGWTFRQKSGSFENSAMFNSDQFLKEILKGKTTSERLRYASAYYNSKRKDPNAPDAKYAIKLAANFADKENVGLGDTQKRYPISFNDGNLSLQTNRIIEHVNSAGVHMITASPKTGKKVDLANSGLEGFLKRNNISGHIPSNSVSVVWDRANGNDVYDINFTTRVRKSDIKKYLGSDEGRVLRALGNMYGIKLVKKSGQTIKPGNSKASTDAGKKNSLEWNDIEYIDIPCVRTIYANDLDNDIIDAVADSEMFTKQTGAKRQGGYINVDDDLDTDQ